MLTVQTCIRVREPGPVTATEPQKPSRRTRVLCWSAIAALVFPFWVGVAEIVHWVWRSIWG